MLRQRLDRLADFARLCTQPARYEWTRQSRGQSMSSLELVANANASNALGLTPDAGARKRARHDTNLGLSEAVQLSQTI